MDEFVSRDAAVELAAAEHNLSVGAAEAAVSEALTSKRVRCFGRVGNLPPARLSADDLRSFLGFLFIGDLKLSAADLRWQLRKQLGNPRPRTKLSLAPRQPVAEAAVRGALKKYLNAAAHPNIDSAVDFVGERYPNGRGLREQAREIYRKMTGRRRGRPPNNRE